MDKKGDLTASQIIIIVIAIVGFLIVLAALFLLNIGGSSEKDICQISILTRATAPAVASQALPLKCKTEKICISATSSGCKAQFAGEENVVYEKISTSNKDAAARRIEEISANAMYDCWDMTGQGKLDIFTHITGGKKVDCLVCSRVAVDESISKDSAIMSLVNVNDYMKTQPVPGKSITYLQAFTDRGVSSYAQVSPDIVQKVKTETPGVTLQGPAQNAPIDFAIVFTQIKSITAKQGITRMLAVEGTVVAGAAMIPGVSSIGKKLLFTPWGLVVAAGATIGVGGYGYYSAMESQWSSTAYCGQFSTTSKSAEGCSAVQVIPYNFQDVNTVCSGNIEGTL